MHFKIPVSVKKGAPRKATEPAEKEICSVFILQKRDFRSSLPYPSGLASTSLFAEHAAPARRALHSSSTANKSSSALNIAGLN